MEKISKFGCGLSVSGLTYFLSCSGTVTSSLAILAALDIFVKELFNNINIGVTILAVLLAVGNTAMLCFSLRLWQKFTAEDVEGQKALIKIGCYVMADLEALACIVSLSSLLRTDVFFQSFGITGIYTGIKWGFPLIFIAMMYIGVKMSYPQFINVYIVFKIVHFLLFVLCEIVVETILLAIRIEIKVELLLLVAFFCLLISGFFYVFSTGFIVLHYNNLMNNKIKKDKVVMI